MAAPAGAPPQRFFDNQFHSIYQILIDTIAPRIQVARDQNDPNLPMMEEEAGDLAYFFYGRMGHNPLQYPFPETHFFPEFEDAYNIVIQLNDQVRVAQEQQDPQAQAMMNELRDREDNLEIFLSEDFLRKFIDRGLPLLEGGRRKRKSRKSRKANRKNRKTRKR